MILENMTTYKFKMYFDMNKAKQKYVVIKNIL